MSVFAVGEDKEGSPEASVGYLLDTQSKSPPRATRYYYPNEFSALATGRAWYNSPVFRPRANRRRVS
jgi:hypothetical protein